jgi:hypothetical protein
VSASIFRVFVAAVSSLSIHAASVSLTNDFSLASNPNGQWVYQDNNVNLAFEIPQSNGNAFIPAVQNGYWGLGNDLNTNTPDFAKVQVNCSGAGETDLDCLAGDIVGHSPNDGSALFLRWTAPSAGTISNLVMTIWYAHSAAGARSNDFVLLDDAATLTSGTVSSTLFPNRNNRDTYNNAGFAVAQGDVIALGIAKTAGQPFGSLDGMTLDFTFTSSVPEPATLACTGLCLVLAAFASRKRRRS